MLLEEKKTEVTALQKKYITAWMNILIDGRVGMNFFNRKRMEKRLRSYYEELNIWAEETEERAEGWRDFAKLWIETCVKDKTYSSAAFGMFHLKDETLARKIAGEIDEVTERIPSQLGIAEDVGPLRELFLDQYRSMIGI